MESMMIAATVLLMLFALVAAFDGIYFHLFKYKLYARPESLTEHKMHTASAVLFMPVVFLLFGGNFAGVLLWAAALFILVETVIEIIDVLCEKESRASLGGLSSAEYATHVVAITLRVAAIALALAAKPLTAWQLSSPLVAAETYPSIVLLTGYKIAAGNALMVFVHLWLMRRKYRAEATVYAAACCGV